MKGNRAIVTAVVVVVVLLLGWCLLRRSGSSGAVDLLAQFDQATKKPESASFPIVDAKLGDETKKAIAPPGLAGTRLTWKVRVPDDGWLRVNLGLKPEVVGEAGRRRALHGRSSPTARRPISCSRSTSIRSTSQPTAAGFR